MSTPATSRFLISHHNPLLTNLMSLSLYMCVEFLAHHVVSKQTNYNTERTTRLMIALGNFNAWILVPCVSLAFETKNPAYAALVCLSLVQVFWAARHIYSDFQEAKYPGMQTGITKAMRVAATLLVVPVICYSWHAYSSLATKV